MAGKHIYWVLCQRRNDLDHNFEIFLSLGELAPKEATMSKFFKQKNVAHSLVLFRILEDFEGFFQFKLAFFKFLFMKQSDTLFELLKAQNGGLFGLGHFVLFDIEIFVVWGFCCFVLVHLFKSIQPREILICKHSKWPHHNSWPYNNRDST